LQVVGREKWRVKMSQPDSEEVDDRATDAAGTPEGDGDFESDGLPETGETSAGGQVGPAGDSRDGVEGREHPDEPHGLRKVLDEIVTGKMQP
jgi:hypothetical protein